MFPVGFQRKVVLPALICGAVLGAAIPAQAGTITGVTVRGYGYTSQVGSVNSDGSVNFYALLNGSATYGYNGGGMSADNCTISYYTNNCGGGTLDMWFRFEGVNLGPNVLTLQYNDLDLAGVNDPGYFLESVRVYRNNSTSTLAYINEEWDAGVDQPASNYNTQLIELDINVNTSPVFYVRTRYVTTFRSDAPRGNYTNTVESVRATLVPEPGMLSLLGAGLLAAGLLGQRRRQAAAA